MDFWILGKIDQTPKEEIWLQKIRKYVPRNLLQDLLMESITLSTESKVLICVWK